MFWLDIWNWYEPKSTKSNTFIGFCSEFVSWSGALKNSVSVSSTITVSLESKQFCNFLPMKSRQPWALDQTWPHWGVSRSSPGPVVLQFTGLECKLWLEQEQTSRHRAWDSFNIISDGAQSQRSRWWISAV